MKSKLVVFLLTLLCIFSLNFVVFGEVKEYSFDKVDYIVKLNSDGSADVTEKWVVNYKKGEFTRLYKNIFLDLPKEEQFRIDNWSVKIDGIPCMYTDDIENRPDYHFGLIENGSILTYEVYALSKNQTRTYEISYTLYDVVKNVGDEFYLFTYRYLPNDYKNNIGLMNITILLPENSQSEVLYKTKGRILETEISNKICIEAKNVSDMYKVKVKINTDGFTYISASSFIDNSDLNSDVNSDLNIGFNMVFFVIINAIISFISFLLHSIYIKKQNFLYFSMICLFSVMHLAGLLGSIIVLISTVKTISIKNKVLKNPNIIMEKINKWVPKKMSYITFISKFAKNKYLLFMIYLAELNQQRFIYFSDDYKYIYFPCNIDKNNPYIDILMVLENCKDTCLKKGLNVKVEKSYWKLSANRLKEYFLSVDAYKEVSKAVMKDNGYFSIDFKKDIDFIRKGIEFLNKSKRVELEDIINNNVNILDLISFVLNEKGVKGKKGNSYIYTDMCYNGYDYYVTETSKSSSNGSCSSCSSCSSCGGCGGAD